MNRHRITNRAKAKRVRGATSHRAPHRHLQVGSWLGAGAVTLGVGAALASGSAVAYADTGHSGGTTPPTTGGSKGSQSGSPTTGSAATSPTANTATPTGTPPRPKHSAAVVSASSTDSAGGLTGLTSHLGTVAAQSQGRPGPTPLHASALVISSPVNTPAPSIPTAVSKALVTTSSVVSPSASPATVPLTLDPPTPVKVNPLEPLANAIADLVLVLGGMNPANPVPSPSNPLQLFLFSLAKKIEGPIDPAPPAGTPTIGTPDPITGTVTGSLGFGTDPSNDLTFTTSQPGQGMVTVDSAGNYTYTPTQAARQAATATTTDTFTATVHDGLSSNAVMVTVPVDAGTPQADTPTVGSPDMTTGAVSGMAVFTDPAGRTLTYTVSTNPTEGKVTVNSATGAYTYTPTEAARLVADIPGGANTDTFDVTASNGVHSTPEIVNVPISPAFLSLTDNIPTAQLNPIDVAVSPDGSRIYVANLGDDVSNVDGTLQIFNATTKALIDTLTFTGQNSADVAVSPDGKTVYVPFIGDVTESTAGGLGVVSTATNTITATLPESVTGQTSPGVAISPDGTKLYVLVVSNTNAVDVINTATDKVTATISLGNGLNFPTDMAISPDGSKLYVPQFSDPGTVAVIDTATNTVSTTITGLGNDPQGVAISPDGTHLYVTNGNDNTVSVINTATDAVTATIPVDARPDAAAVSPDGSVLYVTNFLDAINNGEVTVINTATNSVITTVQVGIDPSGIAVSPDGTQAYVTNEGSDTVSVISLS